VAGREGKRGECQTGLGLVWRETGAVRNACPSRGQAASTRKRAKWEKKTAQPSVENEGWLLWIRSQQIGGHQWGFATWGLWDCRPSDC